MQATASADRPQAAIPEPRPSKQLTTSSIKRPDKPVAQPYYTKSRVRLREAMGTNARVITWLEQGEQATVLESSGKWRRVTVAGRKGWVHGDYLQLPDPDAPRPQAPVAKTVPAKAVGPVPAAKPKQPVVAARREKEPGLSAKPLESLAPAISKPLAGLLQSKRPARQAQRGDCQCPYDLMINGKECGDRSAYVMRGRANEQCYL
ncbi:SH3 domain-containing protein [Neomesorhizobium albiziae]|nr:SH3 domain-containing protein [Mesorhizobium albiziae]